MPVTALRGRCAQTDTEVGDREFPRCLITNDHMNCGSRFPPKRKRSTPCQKAASTGKKRCRMHGGAKGSGAPPGERNGNYRHGLFTREAIAERRALRALIRDFRGAL